jgi:hypothetical protein
MDEERVRRNRCRKSFVAKHVLGVINFDGGWICVLAGWEGSAHDGQAFNDALLSAIPSQGMEESQRTSSKCKRTFQFETLFRIFIIFPTTLMI